MKRVILLLALCMILAQPVSADYSPTDIVPDLISKGFDMILELQAETSGITGSE